MPEPSQEHRYQYRGDLQHTALPEVLYTIFLHRVPGLIEARRGDVVKKVWVRDGAVVHAASTDLDDSLGVWLRRSERITREQFDRSMRQRSDVEGKRHGELLLEQDVLSPAELYEAIQEQIRAIVWSLFSWGDGEVTFSIGDFEEKEMIRIQLPMRQVILEGVKRVPDAKSLVARLGRKETLFDAAWSAEELIEAALNREELALLRMVDGNRALYELCTTGPYAPAENARLVYAFHVLRLIRRRPADRTSGVVKIRFRNP